MKKWLAGTYLLTLIYTGGAIGTRTRDARRDRLECDGSCARHFNAAFIHTPRLQHASASGRSHPEKFWQCSGNNDDKNFVCYIFNSK